MIVLEQVSKDFGHGQVLGGITMEIDPGEMVCMVGESGAGKSILLSLIAGADTPTSGSITIDGVPFSAIPPQALHMFRRKIGIVYQDGKLLQNRTVEENIAFPLEACGAEDGVITERVTHIMDALGLYAHRKLFPRELACGERARVAIARSIAHQPIILLVDEPTQALDPDQIKDVLQMFRAINAAGTTVVIATRNTEIAKELDCRVIALHRGAIMSDTKPSQSPTPVATPAMNAVTDVAMPIAATEPTTYVTKKSPSPRKIMITREEEKEMKGKKG